MNHSSTIDPVSPTTGYLIFLHLRRLLKSEANLLYSDEFKKMQNINVKGFMGMATNTDDNEQVRKEFTALYKFYSFVKDQYNLDILSMGMTSDYKIALDCGSNMVRIGSAIFGERG